MTAELVGNEVRVVFEVDGQRLEGVAAHAGVLVIPERPDPRSLPVLVGMNNPYGDDPRFVLYDLPTTAAGYRLQHVILGLHPRTYRGLARHNICVGDFRMRAARRAAAHLEASYADRVLILLGRQVAAAFGFPDAPFFTAQARPGGPLCLLLYHPSGQVTAWNRPEVVAQARALIASALPDLPLGEADQDRDLDRAGDAP